MGPPSFVVEFTGPSGVGKSTLATEVLRVLVARGVTATLHGTARGVGWSPAARRSGSVRAVVRHPRLAGWCTANLLVRSRPLFHRIPTRVTELCRAAERAEWLRTVPGIHLVDEGAYRHLPGLLARQRSVAAGLVRALPRLDLCVAVDASPATAEQRRRARGSAVDAPGYKLRKHQLHRDALELIAAAVPVLVISTDSDDLEVAAGAVVRRILATWPT